MRVIIAAGEKTQSIVDAMKTRFSRGEVVVDGVKWLSEIMQEMHKGEMYDRVIVVEPSLKNGARELDIIRQEINTFNSDIKNINPETQLVFTLKSKDIAQVVSEEMFIDNRDRYCIMMVDGVYKVRTFVDACILEMNKIPDKYSIESNVNISDTAVEVNNNVNDIEVRFNRVSKSADSTDIGITPTVAVADIENKPEQEKLEQERLEQEKLEQERLEQEKLEQEKLEQEKLEQERLEQEKLEQERIEQERLEQEKLEQEKLEQERLERERIEKEKLEQARLEQERLEQEKLEQEKLEQEKLEQEKLEQERLERERLEQERIEKEKLEQNDLGNLFEDGGTWDNDYADKEKADSNDADDNTESSLSGAFFENLDKTGKQDSKTEASSSDYFNNCETGEEKSTQNIGESSNGEFFSEADYAEDSRSENIVMVNSDKPEVVKIKKKLETISNSHESFVFTGMSGAGKTTFAFNTAALLAKFGYSVLYVDLDTKSKGGAYIYKDMYEWIHSNDSSCISLMQAIGNPANIVAYEGILEPGLHVLSMGIEQDYCDIDKLGTVNKEKMSRFIGMARQNYNFVVYDIPYNVLCSTASDLMFTSNNIMYMVDGNTRGFMNILLDTSNTDDDEIRLLAFQKMQIVINKDKIDTMLFGKKIRNAARILSELDDIVKELLGGDVLERYAEMRVLHSIPYCKNIDDIWMTNKKFIDSPEGMGIVCGMLKNILHA